jgi:hypothetical protein
MRRQDSPLKIPRDQKRYLALQLQLVEQCNDVITTPDVTRPALRRRRHGHRPDVISANIVSEFEVAGTSPVEVLDPQPDHEELSDLLFQRKTLQSFLCPAIIDAFNALRWCFFRLCPRFSRRP